MPRAARNLLIVLLIAISTHALAVLRLPQDFDEPVYVQVAMEYARALESGDLRAIVDYPGVREHPALVKLAYGIAVFVKGEANNYSAALRSSRTVSAVFGVLAALIVTLLDPLAGGLLAAHTLVVKYSSQAYLEAIPLALVLLSLYAFRRSGEEGQGSWFWCSAVALGAAGASKFTYIPVTVVVISYIAFFERKVALHRMALFGLLAAAAFLAFNPALWHDPIERMLEALGFHLSYQQGAHVQEMSYPWYQPFVWLFIESPGNWHPAVFFYDVDQFIAFFAFAGIPREWRERRWLVVWLAAGLVFLLLWGTKWPQYVLTIVPAICLMAAESLRRAYRWFTNLGYYNSG